MSTSAVNSEKTAHLAKLQSNKNKELFKKLKLVAKVKLHGDPYNTYKKVIWPFIKMSKSAQIVITFSNFEHMLKISVRAKGNRLSSSHLVILGGKPYS